MFRYHHNSSQSRSIHELVEEYYNQHKNRDRELLDQLHQIVYKDNCEHSITDKFMIVNNDNPMDFLSSLRIRFDCNIHSEVLFKSLELIKEFKMLLKLELTGKLIFDLPEDLTMNMRFLFEFKLKNTSVKEIPKDIFLFNEYLYTVIITDNPRLEKVPGEIFKNSKELSLLNITGNKLESLPLNLLDDLLYLSHLWLRLDDRIHPDIRNYFKNRHDIAVKEFTNNSNLGGF